MSMSYFVFVNDLPIREEWQSYFDMDQIPIKLIESIEVKDYCGFVPMELDGYDSGVEIYLGKYDPEFFPEVKPFIGDRNIMVSFRFGGDYGGLCCSSAAAAVLAKRRDGVAYFDVHPQTYEQMMYEYNEALSDAKLQCKPIIETDVV